MGWPKKNGIGKIIEGNSSKEAFRSEDGRSSPHRRRTHSINARRKRRDHRGWFIADEQSER